MHLRQKQTFFKQWWLGLQLEDDTIKELKSTQAQVITFGVWIRRSIPRIPVSLRWPSFPLEGSINSPTLKNLIDDTIAKVIIPESGHGYGFLICKIKGLHWMTRNTWKAPFRPILSLTIICKCLLESQQHISTSCEDLSGLASWNRVDSTRSLCI